MKNMKNMTLRELKNLHHRKRNVLINIESSSPVFGSSAKRSNERAQYIRIENEIENINSKIMQIEVGNSIDSMVEL